MTSFLFAPADDAVDTKRHVVALLGRILVALLFILAGWGKISGVEGVAGYIASKGLPMPQVLAWATIALELGGGILIAIGYQTRLVAVLFFLWLIPTTFLFHKYWGIDPAQAQAQFNNFYKNVSIMGAMALLFAFGPGAYSVDKR
jgi:putative oxidoreductase